MERRLRIRIERVFPTDDTVIEEISVPPDYIVEYAKNNRFSFGYTMSDTIYGMSAKVVISKFDTIKTLGLIKDDINFLNDYSDIIANIKIEINTDYKDKVWENPNFKLSILAKHFILSAVQSQYKKYGNIIEVIQFIDYSNKNIIQEVKPKISRIGTPYRLYVNNQLITEKFYPYSLYEDQQLEEVIFVDLTAGTHNVKLTPLVGDKLKINGFACDDQIITNISVNELSFQIQ
jgi:hypothetical protein